MSDRMRCPRCASWQGNKGCALCVGTGEVDKSLAGAFLLLLSTKPATDQAARLNVSEVLRLRRELQCA